MIWLSRRVLKDFRYWDRPTQIAFVLAVFLLIVGVLLSILAPQEQRTAVIIGVGALLAVAEIAVLWGNRGMVNIYTQAQRLYLNGDLEQARELLEKARSSDKFDMRSMTLLGNTYRQLGRLDESAAVLYEALDKAPEHHFPLYNLGRTVLAQGQFEQAIGLITHALEAGAPPVVRFDLGEAYYWMGAADEASQQLHTVQPDLTEPHRQLMAAWMLHRMGRGTAPDASLVELGIVYWQAAVDRFAATPYGQMLSEELRVLAQTSGDAARS